MIVLNVILVLMALWYLKEMVGDERRAREKQERKIDDYLRENHHYRENP